MIPVLVLFAFILNRAEGRNIILLTHQEQFERIKIIKNILIENQGMPEQFIKIEQRNGPCDGRENALLWICIDEQAVMRIQKVSPYISKGHLAVFKKEIKNDK